jgi:hypothetical protein
MIQNTEKAKKVCKIYFANFFCAKAILCQMMPILLPLSVGTWTTAERQRAITISI